MTFVPRLVAVDFETQLDGLGSTEFWKPGFSVLSAAFSWYGEDGKIVSEFRQGSGIRVMLERLAELQVPLMAHNIAFEMGVAQMCYPDVKLNWSVDTMRLVLVYDAGQVGYSGESAVCSLDAELASAASSKKPMGVGLKASMRRILPEHASRYVEPFGWIASNFPKVKVTERGKCIPHLPVDLLREYNVSDTECTLLLYTHIVQFFEKIKYDWRPDHDLYLNSTRLITTSESRGVRVDLPGLQGYIDSVQDEIDAIGENFKKRFSEYITQVEDRLHEEVKAKCKTEKGRAAAKRPVFNVGSNRHLGMLFVDVMGLSTPFKTPKGQPSMKASHIGAFGEAGQMLESRRGRMLVKTQSESLYERAEADGRWHLSLNTCGTVTGRFSGTGGLNALGLARRDKMVSFIKPDPGNVVVSIDLAAGEPTVTTHFSNDRNMHAILEMVGKEPRMVDGVLMIDDIYLMCMSVSPVNEKIMKLWKDGRWDGRTFAQQWMVDPEVIKKELKYERKFVKCIVLALAYGLGPKKMVQHAMDHGFSIDMKTSRAFFKSYWRLFAQVKDLGDMLATKRKREGHIINPFGYRILPEADYKCLNYFCQSTVSGILHVFNYLLSDAFEYARFITVIHDELLVEVPADRVDEFRAAAQQATQDLNDMLGWTVAIRSGWATGGDWLEAK